ncbi:PREDICTED: uncharacterized protein LOC108752331 isoform X2 [Trachymyrmex septentrionalis]|uniref:uncharacterized protein LOC108752331 isoform X2 n=1 Tax=Trachymyrmex septentrionalis TaxID=34720 RepID=UPI00084F7B5A|nr:PREDICTED: uncharacterized protein LOC108752331 isoform X2 [Trachymyrmex septentrionalis]XP_018348613.1 PREDICTED: uncharacterized protein LOC108752331 isoform X2 [Trachymyrmex septentrionalis]
MLLLVLVQDRLRIVGEKRKKSQRCHQRRDISHDAEEKGIRITKTEERNKSLISTYNCKSKSDMCDSAKDEQTTGKDAGDVQGYQERIKQSERRPCDFALFPTSRTTSYGLLFPCRRDAESSD